MENYQEIIDTSIENYSVNLPWGIYFYNPLSHELKWYGNRKSDGRYEETEKYLSDTIRDICVTVLQDEKVYTETSPSGMVYIAVPLFINGKVWSVLATYLCLGREGSWRRSLNRGISVSQAVDLLDQLGFILTTHEEVRVWFSPGGRITMPETEPAENIKPSVSAESPVHLKPL